MLKDLRRTVKQQSIQSECEKCLGEQGHARRHVSQFFNLNEYR